MQRTEAGAAVAECEGLLPRSTMRVPQPDIIEHFGNADAVPQPPERCLSRKAGIMRCCLYIVGRGLDPYAAFRRRSPPRGVGDAAPYSGNPHGFSLPPTSPAAWGQAALHPTLSQFVGGPHPAATLTAMPMLPTPRTAMKQVPTAKSLRLISLTLVLRRMLIAL